MSLFNREKKEQYKIVEPPLNIQPKVPDEVVHSAETERVNPVQTPSEELKEEPKKEENILQVPVFLTPADVNRMIYENNIMLKRLINAIQKE